MMTTLCRRAALATTLLFFAVFLFASPASADVDAPLDVTCADASLPAEPDASALVDLPFALDTGDADLADSLYVSENGWLSFESEPGPWAQVFELGELSFNDNEIIAPLYGDASQGAAGSVSYGATTFEGRNAFCVNWTDLEPNFGVDDVAPDPIPTNSFQVVLVERTDRAAGAFDIITNYESIGWDDNACGFDPQFEGPNGCCDLLIPVDAQAAAIQGPCCDFEFDGPCCDFEFEGPCCDFEFDGPCCDIEFDGPCCDDAAIEEGFCCDIGDGIIVPCEFELAALGVFPEGEATASFAGVAFPTGNFDTARVIEFVGSGIIDGMIDPDGLAATSLNSLQPGRHVVEITSGFGTQVGAVVGQVVDGAGDPVGEGLIWVCGISFEAEEFEDFDFDCAFTRTDANGFYTVDGMPLGEYEVTARGPAGSNLLDATEFVEVGFAFGDNFVPLIELNGPLPIAEGVEFGPFFESDLGPVVYWRDDLDVSTAGCAGGVGTWTVIDEGGALTTGSLAEGTPGNYAGTIPALFPGHGNGSVTLAIDCPDPTPDEGTEFTIYIDPSGTVLELQSGEPVAGVTVVLERRDPGAIVFTEVPDGSDIMSPSNRVNPFTTLDDGRFGWDVMAGEYRVSVSKAGCAAIALPAEWADRVLEEVQDINGVPDASVTPVLQVLPEWLGLELFLDCNNAPTIADPGPLTLTAPVAAGDLPTPSVADLDPADQAELTVTNNAPSALPLGETVVTWTVTDPGGASASVTQLVTVTPGVDPDDLDGDGVLNDVDDCPGTTLPDPVADGLAADRYRATIDGFVGTDGVVVITLDETRGCSGLQILDRIPVDPSFDEAAIGLRLSTVRTWMFECASDAGDLSWTDDGQEIYWIYRSTDSGDTFLWAGTARDFNTTFTDRNATFGAQYQVHYQGIDRVPCAIVAEPAPEATPFACDADSGFITWSDDDQSKYWIYRSSNGGASYSWIGKTDGATSFNDPDPFVGAQYQVHYQGIPRVDCTITSEPVGGEPFGCFAIDGSLQWSNDGQAKYWVYKQAAGENSYSYLTAVRDWADDGDVLFTDPTWSPGDAYQVHYQGIPRNDCVPIAIG